MSNYPAGAANDPMAPWNKKDPVEIPWEELSNEEYGDCGHCGKEDVLIAGQDVHQMVCRRCYEDNPEYYDE
jgi:hypothetical protein